MQELNARGLEDLHCNKGRGTKLLSELMGLRQLVDIYYHFTYSCAEFYVLKSDITGGGENKSDPIILIDITLLPGFQWRILWRPAIPWVPTKADLFLHQTAVAGSEKWAACIRKKVVPIS